jgi:hypothetical protein
MLSPWGAGRSLLGDPSIGSIRLGPSPVVRNGQWVRLDQRRGSGMVASPQGSSEAMAGEWRVVPQQAGRRRRRRR